MLPDCALLCRSLDWIYVTTPKTTKENHSPTQTRTCNVKYLNTSHALANNPQTTHETKDLLWRERNFLHCAPYGITWGASVCVTTICGNFVSSRILFTSPGCGISLWRFTMGEPTASLNRQMDSADATRGCSRHSYYALEVLFHEKGNH